MRNYEYKLRRAALPCPASGRGVGNANVSGREAPRSGTDPARHFTPQTTPIVTPPLVRVDLEPFGEREVIDGRD